MNNEVIKTGTEVGIDWAVLSMIFERSKHSHYCAYLRVPKNNPAYVVKSYCDIPLEVNGGLTYGISDLKGVSSVREWIGWDYAHCGNEDTTQEEVIADAKEGARKLKRLTWKDIMEAKMEYMPDWFLSRIEIKEEQ